MIFRINESCCCLWFCKRNVTQKVFGWRSDLFKLVFQLRLLRFQCLNRSIYMVEAKYYWLKAQMHLVKPFRREISELNLHGELYDRPEKWEFTEEHSVDVVEEIRFVLITPVISQPELDKLGSDFIKVYLHIFANFNHGIEEHFFEQCNFFYCNLFLPVNLVLTRFLIVSPIILFLWESVVSNQFLLISESDHELLVEVKNELTCSQSIYRAKALVSFIAQLFLVRQHSIDALAYAPRQEHWGLTDHRLEFARNFVVLVKKNGQLGSMILLQCLFELLLLCLVNIALSTEFCECRF